MRGVAGDEHLLWVVFPPRWHPHCHLGPCPELAQVKQTHAAQVDHRPHKTSLAVGEAECSQEQIVKDFDSGLGWKARTTAAAPAAVAVFLPFVTDGASTKP